jgi:hypothetical protein
MTISIFADEIRPGDVIHLGRARRITSVRHEPGWAWPIAADGTGWGIALDHHMISISRD